MFQRLVAIVLLIVFTVAVLGCASDQSRRQQYGEYDKVSPFKTGNDPFDLDAAR